MGQNSRGRIGQKNNRPSAILADDPNHESRRGRIAQHSGSKITLETTKQLSCRECNAFIRPWHASCPCNAARPKARGNAESVPPKGIIMDYTVDFSGIGMKMIREVGGKNAFLGEMFNHLACERSPIPPGFAITASAYRHFLRHNGLEAELRRVLNTLDACDFSNLAEVGAAARALITSAALPADLRADILDAVGRLETRCPPRASFAVRSSIAADGPLGTNFAGRGKTFLNVRDREELLTACRRCFASLFTDRAIRYRVENGVEHLWTAVSVGVQLMIRSDLGSAGTVLTPDREGSLPETMLLTGAFGLGNVPPHAVAPDRFVLKGSPETQDPVLVSRALGSAGPAHGVSPNAGTDPERPGDFCLSDEEVRALAACCLQVAGYYGQPMRIEWAKDGATGGLFIVQAEPKAFGVRTPA
jgi:pyruvate,water dikinase